MVLLPLLLILQICHLAIIKFLLHLRHKRLAVLQFVVEGIKEINSRLKGETFHCFFVAEVYVGEALLIVKEELVQLFRLPDSLPYWQDLGLLEKRKDVEVDEFFQV